MQSNIMHLITRDDHEHAPYDPTMVTIIIVALTVIILALLAVIGLIYIRYRRRSRSGEALPMYEEKRPASNHRRVAVRPSESIYVYQEKQSLIENSDAPPSASVPEIRITFPEETDDVGKRQSGRVVVVHVGETSMGLEPFSENLPAYQTSEADRFQSLDLDRIGGLKEKDIEARFQ